MKRAVFTGLLTLLTICVFAPLAMAADGAPDNNFTQGGYVALATALGLAIAAVGGAMGQSRAAAAALEGIARNPGAADKIFTPYILGLALIESLVIYSLVFGFVLSGKVV